jgi:hypothetical protein
MLASGTQDRGFAPDRSRRIFPAGKNPQHAVLYDTNETKRQLKVQYPDNEAQDTAKKKKIPDSVTGIFHSHNPSGRITALGSTQPLTVPGIIPWGKGGRCVGLTTLPHSCADCIKIWEPSTCWNLQGLSRPVMGLLLTL